MAITWTEADHERVQGRLAAIVSELPGTVVAADHANTGFLIRGGRFAWLLSDHHGNGRLELWIKAPVDEQDALVRQGPSRYFVPPYLGRHGWVGTAVLPSDDPEWDEIAALVEQAWRLSAGPRAVADYDTRRGSNPGTASGARGRT